MQRPLAAQFDGQVADGAVADSFFMISGFRGDDGARAVGAAVVAVPGERSDPRGHRRRLANSAALTGILAALTDLAALTRAQEAAPIATRSAPTDLLDLLGPAGRRCGCWPLSTFHFSGIVVRRFGSDDGARAIGAEADVGFAGSGGGDGAGAGRGQRATGSSATTPNSAARQLNVELSRPIFRLALAVFIPWRGADGFDRRPGWHPR